MYDLIVILLLLLLLLSANSRQKNLHIGSGAGDCGVVLFLKTEMLSEIILLLL